MEMMALLHRNEVIQCGYVGAVVDGFGIAIALSLEHAWTWSVDGRRGMECGVKCEVAGISRQIYATCSFHRSLQRYCTSSNALILAILYFNFSPAKSTAPRLRGNSYLRRQQTHRMHRRSSSSSSSPRKPMLLAARHSRAISTSETQAPLPLSTFHLSHICANASRLGIKGSLWWHLGRDRGHIGRTRFLPRTICRTDPDH